MVTVSTHTAATKASHLRKDVPNPSPPPRTKAWLASFRAATPSSCRSVSMSACDAAAPTGSVFIARYDVNPFAIAGHRRRTLRPSERRTNCAGSEDLGALLLCSRICTASWTGSVGPGPLDPDGASWATWAAQGGIICMQRRLSLCLQV
jgi:hypothetical protein